jgi:hypothetical protein
MSLSLVQDDPYIAVVERGNNAFLSAIQPGHWLVDAFPLCEKPSQSVDLSLTAYDNSEICPKMVSWCRIQEISQHLEAIFV